MGDREFSLTELEIYFQATSSINILPFEKWNDDLGRCGWTEPIRNTQAGWLTLELSHDWTLSDRIRVLRLS